MPGPMGVRALVFVPVWITMMAAMMLPSMAPVAAVYARSQKGREMQRLLLFTAGYLMVWAVMSPVFHGLTVAASAAVMAQPAVARAAPTIAFLAAAVYQLSRLKEVCLRHCRSPFAAVVQFASFSGPLRSVRAGAHHGVVCLGCCWALMLILVAVGLMNLLAMVILALAILLEKGVTKGVWFSRSMAAAALGFGIACLWLPQLAPGLAGLN